MWPTHCHLVPRLGMSGTIFPLQPCAFMTSTGTTAASCTQILHYSVLGYRVCSDSAPWFRTHYIVLGYKVCTDSALWFRTHYIVLGYKVCTDSAPWFRTHYIVLGYKVCSDSAPWIRTHYIVLGYRVCSDSAPWFRTHNSVPCCTSPLIVHCDSEHITVHYVTAPIVSAPWFGTHFIFVVELCLNYICVVSGVHRVVWTVPTYQRTHCLHLQTPTDGSSTISAYGVTFIQTSQSLQPQPQPQISNCTCIIQFECDCSIFCVLCDLF